MGYSHCSKYYNKLRLMNWRRLELWATIATIALYAAAVVSLIIMLGESVLPKDSTAQRTFHDIANYLNRLGEIGGGTIILVILLILVGGGIIVLFIKAWDKYQENRARRAREIAEALSQGRQEGREEGHAEIRDQLQQRGYDLNELLSSNGRHPDSGNVA